MEKPIKINSLELENVKRIKAVKLEPTKNGLTVIGGKNGQGKTSVLDSIMWTLGGKKYEPSQPHREGSFVDPQLRIELSNGVIVERGGKNGSLKVTDSLGQKRGQALLDSFVSQFALDLPKFMNSTSQEKAKSLLQIIGVGDQLSILEKKESQKYNERYEIGRIAEQKKKYAAEMVQWDGVPEEIISASELIKQQQEILAKNGENQRIRDKATQLQAAREQLSNQLAMYQAKVDELKEALDNNMEQLEITSKTVQELKDESTEELEANISNIDSVNAKVRDNLNKRKAQEEADEYKLQYDDLSAEIEQIRKDRMDLLKGADLPLEGLTVEDGELKYKGQAWDNMSGSEQMIVSTSIVRKMNPQCGFVLLDKLEQMDLDTLNNFGKWLEKEGLQAIATRVSTGDECSVLIEDGYSVDPVSKAKTADTEVKPAEAWKSGEF